MILLMSEARGLTTELHVPETEIVPPQDGMYIPTIHEVTDIALFMGRALDSANQDPSSPVNIDLICPVQRGGGRPADPVIREMGIKNNQSLAIEFYKPNPDPTGPPEIPSETPIVHHAPRFKWRNRGGTGVLFVDDLLDEGKTARWIRDRWPKAMIAVMYTKLPEDKTLEFVDIYGLQTGKVWIKNPWEVEEELGYSPTRPQESLDWAVQGRSKLQQEMATRRELLYRPELTKRLSSRYSTLRYIGDLVTRIQFRG